MELSSESYGIVLEPGYNVDFICRRTHFKINTKAAVSTFNRIISYFKKAILDNSYIECKNLLHSKLLDKCLGT